METEYHLTGRVLGQYEVLSMLGSGGMGEVYRARDTVLGREVALKVIPAELAADRERGMRFRREAKLLAAVNHPSIATVHGFDEIDGVSFLAMELVEGEDLATRLERGRIPLQEAVALALQIADGLQHAHDRGVVHRDLKPANVVVSADGEAKILDFGLARALAGEPEENENGAESPTLSIGATRAGMILGTAGYMSPEQARGRTADHRADVWAFGVVLYEMLAGRRLFAGETMSDTLAAVLRADPDWSDLPSDTPSGVRRVLERCLVRDRRYRLQAVGDARFDLHATEDTTGEERAARVRWWGWLAAAGLLGVGLVAGWVGRGAEAPSAATAAVVHSVLPMPDGVRLAGWASPALAISPNGRTIAFVGTGEEGQHLYLRSLDDPVAVRVPDSEWAEGPFFSPDGEWVAFANGQISGAGSEPGRLRRYSLADSRTQVICDIGDFFGGAWRGDGTIFYVDNQPLGLWRVDARGGEPVRVGGPIDAQALEAESLGWPQVLPGGERALVTHWIGRERGRLAIINLESGELTDLGVDGHLGRYVSGGYLVWRRGLKLEGARFEVDTGRVLGGTVELISDISVLGNDAAAAAVSETGTLVYTSGPVSGSRAELTEIQLLRWDGTVEPLGLAHDFFKAADISPDGRQVVASMNDGLFIIDVERGTRLKLPSDENVHAGTRTVWSPDGQSIVFSGERSDGRSRISVHVQTADGLSLPSELEASVGESFGQSWVPGTSLMLAFGFTVDRRTGYDIFELDVRRPGWRRDVLVSGADELTPTLSPNGRWLAYASDETGSFQVYLQSFPDLGPKIPVGQGRGAFWSTNGDRLLVLHHQPRFDGEIWVSKLGWSADGTPRPERPRPLVDVGGLRHVTLDGQGRGLVIVAEVPGSGIVTDIQLVQGWTRELAVMLPAR